MTETMNALTITMQYPEENYNLLTPMKTVAEISSIQKPVMNVVTISTNLDDKEVYIQDPAKKAYTDKYGNYHPAHPDGYALTKKGLSKLMRAAGIKIKETKPILPSTCQRCTEINKAIRMPVNCHSCGSKDVAYSCIITVPQLTGESIDITAHKEINIADVTKSMSEKQADEFMKFRNEMCESKAINRALRMALHIKPTYTKEELMKSFVVAYLVPDLDHEDVKKEAIQHFFSAKNELFGSTEQVNMIENKVGTNSLPLREPAALTDSLQTEQAISYMPNEEPVSQPTQRALGVNPETATNNTTQRAVTSQPTADGSSCENCGSKCSASVQEYSKRVFKRVLCINCQRKEA